MLCLRWRPWSHYHTFDLVSTVPLSPSLVPILQGIRRLSVGDGTTRRRQRRKRPHVTPVSRIVQSSTSFLLHNHLWRGGGLWIGWRRGAGRLALDPDRGDGQPLWAVGDVYVVGRGQVLGAGADGESVGRAAVCAAPWGVMHVWLLHWVTHLCKSISAFKEIIRKQKENI